MNGTQCGCGQKGCYEKYASANGLVLVAKQYLAEHPNEPSSLRDVPELTAKAVMDAAKAGDAAATACVDIAAEALGVCCVNLCRIVDPELIVFSGGLATAGDFFLKKIDHYFHLYHWTNPGADLRASDFRGKQSSGHCRSGCRCSYGLLEMMCLL